jgi:hypothetical protein
VTFIVNTIDKKDTKNLIYVKKTLKLVFIYLLGLQTFSLNREHADSLAKTKQGGQSLTILKPDNQKVVLGILYGCLKPDIFLLIYSDDHYVL